MIFKSTFQMLAVPVLNLINFYESNKWTIKKTYRNGLIDQVCLFKIFQNKYVLFQMINLINFSSCRTLFLVGYVDGMLTIVNRISFDIYYLLEKYFFYILFRLFYIFSFSTNGAVCSSAWNPINTNQFICSNTAASFNFFQTLI